MPPGAWPNCIACLLLGLIFTILKVEIIVSQYYTKHTCKTPSSNYVGRSLLLGIQMTLESRR